MFKNIGLTKSLNTETPTYQRYEAIETVLESFALRMIKNGVSHLYITPNTANSYRVVLISNEGNMIYNQEHGFLSKRNIDKKANNSKIDGSIQVLPEAVLFKNRAAFSASLGFAEMQKLIINLCDLALDHIDNNTQDEWPK